MRVLDWFVVVVVILERERRRKKKQVLLSFTVFGVAAAEASLFHSPISFFSLGLLIE